MNAWLLLPPVLGAAFLCQAILNRQISESLGLATAVLINASVFVVVAAMVWLGTRWFPEYFPAFLKPGPSSLNVNAMLLIPGLCGFLFVFGGPWAVLKIGPSKTFVLLVGSQILLSVLVDMWLFDLQVDWTKWLGAGLAVAGAVLFTL